MPNDYVSGLSALVEVVYCRGGKAYQESLTAKQHQLFLQLCESHPLKDWHNSLFEGENAMSLGEWLDWFANGSSPLIGEKQISKEIVTAAVARAWGKYVQEHENLPPIQSIEHWRMIFRHTFGEDPRVNPALAEDYNRGDADPRWDILLHTYGGLGIESEYRMSRLIDRDLLGL